MKIWRTPQTVSLASVEISTYIKAAARSVQCPFGHGR